jgi:hypothetical protein
MTFRRSYWSCSKFAAWLRSFQDIPSPYALSSDEWEAYKEEHKGKLCYKLAEWLDNVQDVVYYPVDLVRKVCRNVHNLWIGTHCLKTSLKKGQWHEFDTLVKYGIMENFIDFVEKELYPHVLLWNEDTIEDKSLDGVLDYWVEMQSIPLRKETNQKILDLYKKSVYIMRERVDVWDLDLPHSSDYFALEEAQLNEDTEVLVGIVKLRNNLWT